MPSDFNCTFLILAHDMPDELAELVNCLAAEGQTVCVHYDKRSADSDLERVREETSGYRDQVLFAERVACAWGEFSLVEATLNGLRAIKDSGNPTDYVFLLSGADMPIRSVAELLQFLEQNKGKQFIESFSADHHDWVKDGLRHERYEFYHHFNWQKKRAAFDISVRAQRFLKVKRKLPPGFVPHFGSQWWCLTWDACSAILEKSTDNYLAFFRKTWIPDEMYFQSLIREFASDSEITNRNLSYFQFDELGKPLILYDDSLSYLTRQGHFFARKISPRAKALRKRLFEIARSPVSPAPLTLDSVGYSCGEYSRFARSRRFGLYGKPRAGKYYDRAKNDLEWLRKPFTVYVGISRQPLRDVTRMVNERTNAIVHGHLFDHDRIEFAAGESSWDGLPADATAMRNYMPIETLVRVIRTAGTAQTGFAFQPDDNGVVANALAYNKDVCTVICYTDPVEAYHRWANIRLDIEHNVDLDDFCYFLQHYENWYRDREAQCRERGQPYLRVNATGRPSLDPKPLPIKAIADFMGADAKRAHSSAYVPLQKTGIGNIDQIDRIIGRELTLLRQSASDAQPADGRIGQSRVA